MHEVVFNACYGGFGLSEEALDWLRENAEDARVRELSGQYALYEFFDDCRHHKDLVAVVKALGDKANGSCSCLEIAKISGKQYRIEEYDGYEEVVTSEDSNWVIIED